MVDLTLTPLQASLRDDLRAAAIASLRLPKGEGESTALSASTRDFLAGRSDLPGADGFASGTDDPLSFCLAAESLGSGDPGAALAWASSRQTAWVIASCGSDVQRKEWSAKFADNPLLPASLMFFEGFGRAPSEYETTARRDGDGWVIDGTKIGVAFSAEAEVIVVAARDEAGALIAFVCDDWRGSVTFELPEAGQLALTAVPLATAHINGLRVGGDAVLGSGDLAYALAVCRLVQAEIAIGVADGSTRYAAEWGRNRIAFGKPLVGFQGYSFVLADLFMDIEVARLGVQDALSAKHAETEALTAQAVGQSNQLVGDAGREGVELMGVHGVITDHPAERFFRAAAVLGSIDFDPLASLLVLR